MRKVLITLTIGSMVVLASNALWAQSAGRAAGRGVGRGAGQGAGQGVPAQRGQGQGRFRGDMFTLIAEPAVQKELKLTAGQMDALRELANTEAARKAAQMLSERGSCERTDDRRKVMSQVRGEIERILDEKQWERLEQIWLQVRGVRALLSERISNTLELSREQRGRLTRRLSGGFLGRAAEVEAQALALLTEEQQEQFRKMQGPPFQRNPRDQN